MKTLALNNTHLVNDGKNNKFECSIMINNKIVDSEFYKVIMGENKKQLET